MEIIRHFCHFYCFPKMILSFEDDCPLVTDPGLVENHGGTQPVNAKTRSSQEKFPREFVRTEVELIR
jgi:hypothetical protein